MSLARFMEIGLMHPEFGYYSTKDTIFNKGGDFTTSPEITQMFGEMVGIWLLTALKNYDPASKKGDLPAFLREPDPEEPAPSQTFPGQDYRDKKKKKQDFIGK